MKKLFYACTIVLLIGVFAACRTSTPSTEGAPQFTIVTIGPNVTEILLAIAPDIGDALIATDTWSADIPGVPQGIPLLDMWAIDVETILMLNPSVVVATTQIAWGGDPLALVAQTGIQVEYIPMADSLEGIIDSIRHVSMASGFGYYGGENLANAMQAEIEQVRAIASTITERKTIYFEIDAGPPLFTFGEGSFLNEIVELVGAINIFADYGTWVAVADEQILARNPDVILTNVEGFADPVGEMKARPGWLGLDAVINGRVYLIDANASSRPSHNVISAMWDIARFVYPEYFLQ